MLISGLLAVICAATLNSAPDPDLFDGRYSGVSQGASNAEDGTDGNSEDGDGSVESVNGKAGDNSRELSAEEASGKAKEANGKVFDSGKSGDGSLSAGTAPSLTEATRSFDEFEIGINDATNAQIEIKRSRELGEPTVSSSQSSSQTTNTHPQNVDASAQESGAGDQETFDGSGSADFGNDVPFGL